MAQIQEMRQPHARVGEDAGMAAAHVDVPVALLGYGTVGSAVNRLLVENAEEIERATGHRLRVVRALVRDPRAERAFLPDPSILTTDFRAIADDPEVGLVAEVMGGLDPAGEHVLELLRSGRSVVSANKQLVARRGGELFAAASAAGVQLRFEASVCAAIPVIKVLRESLSFARVHRVLGIVNGTTNFILTRMERGAAYDEALAEAQRLGYAEADPTDDVSGADAAAKMAILATVAFGTRVSLDDVWYLGIEEIAPLHIRAARELEMVVRLVGAATIIAGRPGVLADVARRLAAHSVSVARLVQHEVEEGAAALHVVLHECRAGALGDALVEIAELPETLRRPTALPVISDRGVPGSRLV